MSGKRSGDDSAPARGRLVSIGLRCVLLVAVLVAYYPAWNGQPIWDDDGHLTKPALQSTDGLVRIWTTPGATQQYYPLVHTAFWAMHKLWGEWPLPYHLLNILLHGVSALLLLNILLKLEVPGAWLAAFLFALHPVEVESVAWISELKNALSGVLYLSAALAYLRFDKTRSGRWYAAAFGLFLLALMCKTVVASLPAALLVVWWWKRGTLNWKKDVLPTLPLFAAGIVAGLFTAYVEKHFIGAQGKAFELTFIQRCLISGRAFGFYLVKLFWPAQLSFMYPRWTVSPSVWWQYLFPAGGLVLLAGLWRLSRRHRGPLAAALFFGGTLFPALGFVNVFPFRYSFVADHFQYLASIGIFTLAAAGCAGLLRWIGSWGQARGNVVCAAMLLVLGCLTWQQCGMYIGPEKLWRTTLELNPNSYMAHDNLGNLLRATGRLGEAIEHYQSAILADPDDSKAHNNLGVALLDSHRLDEAISQLRLSLDLATQSPEDTAQAHYNLGNAFLAKKLPDEAVREYRASLEINSRDVAVLGNLGSALVQSGHASEAIPQFERVLEIQPDNISARNNLPVALIQAGRVEKALKLLQESAADNPRSKAAHKNFAKALLKTGRQDEALGEFGKVLEIDPQDAESWGLLGMIYLGKHELGEGIKCFEQLLKVQPENVQVLNDSAWILATCPDGSVRNGAQAVEWATRASELTKGSNPAILATLAAAYAEAGRFNEAVETSQKVLDHLADGQDNAKTAELKHRIEQYKSGKPFRDPGLGVSKTP